MPCHVPRHLSFPLIHQPLLILCNRRACASLLCPLSSVLPPLPDMYLSPPLLPCAHQSLSRKKNDAAQTHNTHTRRDSRRATLRCTTTQTQSHKHTISSSFFTSPPPPLLTLPSPLLRQVGCPAERTHRSHRFHLPLSVPLSLSPSFLPLPRARTPTHARAKHALAHVAAFPPLSSSPLHLSVHNLLRSLPPTHPPTHHPSPTASHAARSRRRT